MTYRDDFTEEVQRIHRYFMPFPPPRSLLSVDDKVVKLILESSSAIENAGKIVCVIERGARSYGSSRVKGFRNDNVFATPGNRLPLLEVVGSEPMNEDISANFFRPGLA